MTVKQLIVGMPDSGKTTFIGALRTQLNVSGLGFKLSLARLSTSEAHVRKLEEKWLSCEQVDRTASGSDKWIELHLKDNSTGDLIDLLLPDSSGETFKQPAATGTCKHSLYEAMANCKSVALFTNADRGTDDQMIHEVIDIIEGEESEEQEFDPSAMPEEVNLVELLQVFNRSPQRAKRRKLAVLISAWDVIEEDISPEDWLQKCRPMLYQFLSFNRDLWEARIYGVSAQGGKLPADKTKLQAVDEPALRVKVVDAAGEGNDLSAPLYWLVTDRG